MNTDTPSSWIGTVVSHYRILEKLGAGGMGVVYRAVDARLDRPVALKFLPPEISHLKEAKKRFIQEAKAASALDHPNICTIYEIGATDDGQLFIAMACYDGETLKSRLSRGRLSVAETAGIMRQVASGLAESHECDIIHRDIKPANIWLIDPGREAAVRVKILDFGLAKVSGRADLTRTGSSMGTPAYMSPEHARGERVDCRTDLWSLGVLSYEAMTGKVPFTGNSIPAIMYALLAREPRPLRDHCPDVPPEMERIVARLMRKQSADRYPSCRALLRDLDRVPGLPTAARAIAGEGGPSVTASPAGAEPGSSAPEPAPTLITDLRPSATAPAALPRRPAGAPRSRAASPLLAADEFDEHLARGLEAALARSYHRAREAFEQALKLRPGDMRAQFNLARIRRRIEERSGAGRGVGRVAPLTKAD